MKHILVPTDFSRCSSNALKYALEIARRTGATLHIVHIVLPHGQFNDRYGRAIRLEEYLMERDTYLDRLARRLKRTPANRGLSIQTATTTGYPVTRILEEADRVEADLIVLGTTGTTALSRLFVGSTTGGVLEQSRVPVFAVPPKGAFKAFSNVALATDFESCPDRRSLAVLRDVLDPGAEKIEVIHVLNRKGAYPDKAVEERFAQKLGGLKPRFNYLRNADVPGEIVNFLDLSQAETLVTVVRQRNLVKRLLSRSMSKELARRVQVPILVLQEE